MSRLLNWRAAIHDDIPALQQFECTVRPARRKTPPYGFDHPRPWELAVEKWIRDQQPPVKSPYRMWVGLDDNGDLGAAAVAEELDGPGSVFLCLMAIAFRHRYQGGGYGDEMVEFLFNELVDRGIASGLTEVSVEARIHRENHASQWLARRWKLRHVGWVDAELQIWATVLDLPTDESDFGLPVEPSPLVLQ